MPDIRFFVPKIDLTLEFHPLDDIRFAPTEVNYIGPLDSNSLKQFAEKLAIFFGRVIEDPKEYKRFQIAWPLKIKAEYFDDFA